jgi:ABC-2 type transport system ATP-binding protein
MNRSDATSPVVTGQDLRKTFVRGKRESVLALDGVSLTLEPGTLAALVGPDGSGKTTLLRLIAGLLTADAGELRVLGVDAAADPEQIQARIGYMPQRFGLYEDLTVEENLNLYADLHGASPDDRRERFPKLLEMTALGPFLSRLAGRLSGGMKQKLGLACTLVRSPELLLLDEPTVGVDPLSRRELWQIIGQLVANERLTVVVSTSYLDEAERAKEVVVLHRGKVLAHGPPVETTKLARDRTFVTQPPPDQPARELQARLLDDPAIVDARPEGGRIRFIREAGNRAELREQGLLPESIHPVEPRFEDGFMVLLRKTSGDERVAGAMQLEQPKASSGSDAVIQVQDLVRRFGQFVAVDHVSFEVRRGEIFGLLGPNGAGKTTTFRMLCGLLPATSGTLRVAGVDLHHARASARQRIGYVAQKFSLYGQLTVTENLQFFASAYSLRGARKRERIQWALDQFDLADRAGLAAGQLPGGYQQRLAMAAALLHEPEIVFLDEPTSGADPLARREFWRRITSLAEQGVTVIVTTHFMEEAEYCDRVVILDAGRILAQGTPAEIRQHGRPSEGREPTMEDAFVAIVEEARQEAASHPQNAEDAA